MYAVVKWQAKTRQMSAGDSKKICLPWSFCEASAFLAEVGRVLMIPPAFINFLPSVLFSR